MSNYDHGKYQLMLHSFFPVISRKSLVVDFTRLYQLANVR